MNNTEILSFQDAEKKYGKLLSAKEAITYFKYSIPKQLLQAIEEEGKYKGLYLVVGKDVEKRPGRGGSNAKYYFPEPLLKKWHQKTKSNLPSFEEAEKKYGTLITVSEAAPYFKKGTRNEESGREGTSWKILRQIVEAGYFRDCYLECGADIQPKVEGHSKGYFILEKIKNGIDLSSVLTSLHQIGKRFGVERHTLKNWKKKGWLDEAPRISEQFWDIQWFEKNIDGLIKRIKQNSFLHRMEEEGPIDWVASKPGGQKIIDWIDEYANHRKNGGSITIGGTGIKRGKKPAQPDETFKLTRRTLGYMCYKIICGRAGLDNYGELERIGTYRKLTDDEWEKFNPDLFEVTDFCAKDVPYMKEGYKDTTFYLNMEKFFKPFIWYVHSKEESDNRSLKREILKNPNVSQEIKDEYERKRDLLELWKDDILEAFDIGPQEIPEVDEEDQRPAIHLTREQILLFIKNIADFQYQGSLGLTRKFNDPLKRITIFLLGCFTGLRNVEMSQLRIDDFELDNNGLLQRFEFDPNGEYKTSNLKLVGPSKATESPHGYGLLKIRKEISKGKYGPSPAWGTYIPPSLVTQINGYLRALYKKYPETKGMGYLFRSKDKLPNEPYSSQSIGHWISEYRDILCDFLPEDERKNLTYYDVRHTVADIVVHRTHVDEMMRQHLERVTELHIRHDMKNKSSAKSLVKKNYAKSAGAIEYFSVIQEALNFPINLTGERNDIPYKNFYDWEIEKGYREAPKEVVDIENIVPQQQQVPILKERSFTPEEREMLLQLEQILQDKESFFNEIKEGYKRSFKKKYDMTEDDWLQKLPSLNKEIEALKKKILTIKKNGMDISNSKSAS